MAGKIALNIPVKISTGRAVSTVKPEFRTSYALIRYIASRPFAKSVSSKIDTNSKESFWKTIISRIKEFFIAKISNKVTNAIYTYLRRKINYDGY